MTSNKSPSLPFKYRSVVPDLPPVESYLPFIQSAHQSEWFSNFGPLARRFEAELAAQYGLPGEVCVTASSATAGLSAALLAMGKPGPVLLPAFTFPASLGAIRAAGFGAVAMDVSETTWAIEPAALDLCLRKTGAAAVMLVSPFGLQQEFSEHIDVCTQHGAIVVIDSAAGLGIRRADRQLYPKVMEVFSMHATKPFGVGEGGVVFAHPDYEARIRAALNFSLAAPDQPSHPNWGFNGKLSELHAGVGLAQIDRFASRRKERQSFAQRYTRSLRNIHSIVFPLNVDLAPWQIFPVLMPDARARECAVDEAKKNGLEIRRYYNPSLSLWPNVRTAGSCEISEQLADRMCALPVRSRSTGGESDEIVELATYAVRLACK